MVRSFCISRQRFLRCGLAYKGERWLTFRVLSLKPSRLKCSANSVGLGIPGKLGKVLATQCCACSRAQHTPDSLAGTVDFEILAGGGDQWWTGVRAVVRDSGDVEASELEIVSVIGEL